MAVALAATATGLLLGELALRTLAVSAPQLELDIYRKDSAGNLLLRPGVERRHVTPLWDVAIQVNEAGWRSPSIDRSDQPAALALGDSFAFGWGVEAEESLFFQLAERGVLPTRWLSAGVPGTAPVDDLRLLETVFVDARPELVLSTVFVGNDFIETVLGGSERLRVEDGLLTVEPLDGQPAALGWQRRLARASRLAQLVRALQFRYFPSSSDGPPRTWDAWMQAFFEVHRAEPSERAEASFHALLKSLDGIAEWCAERDARLLVIVIPRSWQVDPAELAEVTAELGLEPAGLDLDRPQRLLAEWGAESGVEVVDLLPVFRRAAASGSPLYFTPDAHWTAAGHRLAAKAVVAEIRSSGGR